MSFSELFFGVLGSWKFELLRKGVEVEIPTREKIFVRIRGANRVRRPSEFRFNEFSYEVQLSGGGFWGYGFGESDSRTLALHKAIAEAFERVIFRNLSGTSFGTETSSGWAAHRNSLHAIRNANLELCERDAVLTHWLTRVPHFEIESRDFPKRLKQILEKRAPIQVGVTILGKVPTALAVLTLDRGHGVASSATAASLFEAIQKALGEAGRIAHMSRSDQYLERAKALADDALGDTSVEPIAHSLVYARVRKLPDWMFGEKISWKRAVQIWTSGLKRSFDQRVLFKTRTLVKYPLTVVCSENAGLQPLYFGSTREAIRNKSIRFERLKNILPGEGINLQPHWVA